MPAGARLIGCREGMGRAVVAAVFFVVRGGAFAACSSFDQDRPGGPPDATEAGAALPPPVAVTQDAARPVGHCPPASFDGACIPGAPGAACPRRQLYGPATLEYPFGIVTDRDRVYW